MGGIWRTVGEIPACDGKLYMTSGGNRAFIAEFEGFVKIKELQNQVAAIGRVGNGTKSFFASFIICGDVYFQKGFNYNSIHDGNVFSARADVGGSLFEFDGLRFEDSKPMKNELIFEIPDLKLIEKLLTISGYQD